MLEAKRQYKKHPSLSIQQISRDQEDSKNNDNQITSTFLGILISMHLRVHGFVRLATSRHSRRDDLTILGNSVLAESLRGGERPRRETSAPAKAFFDEHFATKEKEQGVSTWNFLVSLSCGWRTTFLDIFILVVATDNRVQAQTIESIKLSHEAQGGHGSPVPQPRYE